MLLVCRPGQDHRSLSQLLKDLEKRADGTAPSTDVLGSVGNPVCVTGTIEVYCLPVYIPPLAPQVSVYRHCMQKLCVVAVMLYDIVRKSFRRLSLSVYHPHMMGF